jgi:hypothetical protein
MKTRLQNQLSAVQEQRKGLCSSLQGTSVTLHTILLGVGGTIFNNHMLKLLRSWVLILKELSNLPLSFMFNLSTELVHTRRILFSPIINSHQKTVSGQACNPPDPR